MDLRQRALEEYRKLELDRTRKRQELESEMIHNVLSLFSVRFDWNEHAEIVDVDLDNKVVQLVINGMQFIVSEYHIRHSDTNKYVNSFADLGAILIDLSEK